MDLNTKSELSCAVAKMEKFVRNYDIIPFDIFKAYLKELACRITVTVNKSEIHPYYYSHLMDCINKLMNEDDTMVVENVKCIIYFVKHILKDSA